jgi:hypothetical protein
LGALNQPFLGFLCFQWLEADFVSLRSREASAGWLQGWRTLGLAFLRTAILAQIPPTGKDLSKKAKSYSGSY